MAESERFIFLEDTLPALMERQKVLSLSRLQAAIISLALPVFAEQVLAMLVGISDRLLTGHFLSTDHLAAITVIGYLLWLIYGIFSIFSLGTAAIVARAIGGGNGGEANRAFQHGGMLAVGLSLPAVGIGLWMADPIVSALQLEPQAAKAAAEYLRIVIPAAPLIAFQAVGVSCLRAAGDMVAGFIVMSIVNALNTGLSWVLCLGIGPFPQLGWRGLAVGTAAGFFGGTVCLTILLARGRAGLHFPLPSWRLEGSLLERILKVGLPGGLDNLAVIGCQLWFLALINQLGKVATAAHGVALTIETLAFLPGIAIQAAASTLAGQFLGAKCPREAVRAVKTARDLSCLIMGGGGLALIVLAPWLPYTLVATSQAQVAAAATPLLRIIGLGMVPLAMVMVISSGLRGAGDTTRTLLISLIGFLGVRIPATYILAFPATEVCQWLVIPGFNFGVIGAWYAMVLDLTVRALLLQLYFQSGRWTKVRV